MILPSSSSSSLFFLSFFLVAATAATLGFFVSASDSNSNNNKDQGFFVSPPAWKFDNAATRGSNQFTFQIGQPYASSTGDLGYILGGSYNLNSGNTTFCVFDAMINGTCVEVILNLVGSWKIENIMKANTIDGIIFDARLPETGEVITYRWNSLYGIEWALSRGNIQKRNTLVVDTVYNTLVSPSASQDGMTENIIASGTIDHRYVQYWSTPIPLPYGFNSAWKSYARDFTWMNNYNGVATVGFISVGRVFVLDTDGGKILNQADLPCGYNSSDFKMKAVVVKYNHAILLVYGNVPNSGFVVCALAFNATLDQLWSIQMNETFTPANGDDSVSVIRTSYNDGLFPVPTDHLFISGVKPGNTNNSFLWCFNVQAAVFVWELPRKYQDRYNMPVFFGGYSDEHVAVTINGTIVGLNPVNQNQKWKCNWGCQGTPANYRYASGQIGRMSCVDASSAFRVITMALDTNYTCSLSWQITLNQEIDVVQQNTPALVTTTWLPLEPFVTVLTPDGTVWSMSLRAANQPAPTPFPTPAPTPAPTIPPTGAPGPLLQYAYQAPYDFTDLTLTHVPVMAAASVDGPFVAAIGEATVWFDATRKPHQAVKAKGLENQNKLTTHLGLGTTCVVFYYQSVPLSQSSAETQYSYVALDIKYYVHNPLTVFGGNGQYVAISAEENGDGDLIMLYTNPNNQASGNADFGDFDLIGRAGADSRPATDGTGMLFYSYGVTDGYHDVIKAKTQRGDGTATVSSWTKPLGDGTTKYKNQSSHVGDVIFAYSGNNGYLVFSYLNTLRVQQYQDGGDARLPITNPCNFQPSTNTWELYYPMEMYWLHSAHENVALSIVDTWDQHGDGTYGLCGVNLSSTAGLATTYGILLQNISFIQNIQPIANTNTFAMDAQTLDWHGIMMVFDMTTGANLFSRYRHKSYGAVIVPVPGFDYFFTNLDVPAPQNMGLALLNGRTGADLGLADVACSVFTLVPPGPSDNFFDVICAVANFPQVVRNIRFTPSQAGNYVTSVVWETVVIVEVLAMSNDATQVSVDGQAYVILQLVDGSIVAVSPQAGAAPTPVPPIPTGDAHPASVTVTSLSPRWITPKTIAPTITDLGSLSMKYGSVSFASVDAGMMGGSSAALQSADNARYTVVLAYQAQAPKGATVYDNVPYVLPMNVATYDPVWIGRNAQRSAAAIATMDTIALLVVVSFPTQPFHVDRYGAFTPVATDGAGSVFFSIGSNGEYETIACYKLSLDGTTFTESWSFPVYPRADSGFVPPVNTSHIGAPTYSVANGRGYLTFSWLNSTYTLNAQNGARVSEATFPCGFSSPQDPFNNNAPWPMTPTLITLANDSTIMATRIATSSSIGNGFWAICATSTDGKYNLWSQQLNQLTPTALIAEVVVSTTDIFGTDYFVIDMTTQPLGTGYMVGFQATTGNYWIKSRAKSTGTAPAAQSLNGQYMVVNWDDPSHTDKFLSLVDATSGAISVQCNWACRTQPAAASTVIDGDTRTVYVCALDDHPEVVRAVYFKHVDGQTGYTCETYWEYSLSQNTNSVSPAGTSTIAVGLADGSTATFSIAASVAPMTPSPQETTPTPPEYTTNAPGSNSGATPSSGLSGGVAAAITILVLLAVAIAVGGIYLIRRRNVRRSALNEAGAGMEYGPQSGSSGDGGYGAIA